GEVRGRDRPDAEILQLLVRLGEDNRRLRARHDRPGVVGPGFEGAVGQQLLIAAGHAAGAARAGDEPADAERDRAAQAHGRKAAGAAPAGAGAAGAAPAGAGAAADAAGAAADAAGAAPTGAEGAAAGAATAAEDATGA